MKFKSFVLAMILLLPALAIGKKEEKLRVPAGSNIPSLGIALDASYDPLTDQIVPGYKILSVALTNNSINIMQLDKANDRWIVVDVKGKKHKAVSDLKELNPELYLSLQQKLRQLLEYPSLIQVGETVVVDLLIKENVGLEGFKLVSFSNNVSKMEFEIISQE
ncbi:MAG: hypothetical protein HYT75_08570 [Deltaproteobacteria bacterium]|nr:hypothetical protein [Deltaproteobacteria bacterium]